MTRQAIVSVSQRHEKKKKKKKKKKKNRKLIKFPKRVA